MFSCTVMVEKIMRPWGTKPTARLVIGSLNQAPPSEAIRDNVSDIFASSLKTSPGGLLSAAIEAKEFTALLPKRANRILDAVSPVSGQEAGSALKGHDTDAPVDVAATPSVRLERAQLA